ncbi:MAG: outer membrane beta-barrel protein [Melioribacteraceae bacterium]|nr:outer membrane beta-barrel protein [Melioribacteraceae bacterium]MCF8353577.1 outer membrane beta-barrel protein [Melioribacteraceae bacterium]MCF8393500.1 outer membrane beta-barrel protein [Melioribacteraceae bacterium]MCF8419310.1 outer membrane beta-barrel protein [Melioribacteraceae bacterium]
MMKLFSNIFLVSVIFILSSAELNAQYYDNGFSISASYSYTTTSEMFYYPNASDPFLRNQSIPMDGLLHPSVEIRYKISDEFAVGINAEYIRKTINVSGRTIPSLGLISNFSVEDGYSIIPVEFNGFYLLPFSTERFKFFMGGGLGIYFGKHIRNIIDVTVSSETREVAYGIQVSVGMDYMIRDNISIRTEMRFRDPDIEFISTYDKNEFEHGNNIYRIPVSSFPSKVNINGITFAIGAAYHL